MLRARRHVDYANAQEPGHAEAFAAQLGRIWREMGWDEPKEPVTCPVRRQHTHKGGKPTKRIRAIETGQEFGSLVEAGKSVGQGAVGIAMAIRRGYRCGKFHWKYA